MHVGLRTVLDAPVDTVRDALLSPSVMVAVTKPFLRYRSRSPEGFPARWTPGEPHPIAAPFNLDRFRTGRLIDEAAAAAVAH